MNSKATLNKKIKLNDGTVFKKDTISEFLIKKENGNYHFEAMGSSCEVKAEEITMVDVKHIPENKVKKKTI